MSGVADPAAVLHGLTGPAALAATAAGLVAAGLALAVTRRPGAALGVLLDLLLAAGLLRLTGDPGWATISTAAVVVLLRHLIGTGLRLGARAWSGRAGTPPTAPGALHRLLDRLRPLRDRLPTRLAEDLLRPAWRR